MHSLGLCSGCAFFLPELGLATSLLRPELAAYCPALFWLLGGCHAQLSPELQLIAAVLVCQNCSLLLQFWSARTAGMAELCCRNGQHSSAIPGCKWISKMGFGYLL